MQVIAVEVLRVQILKAHCYPVPADLTDDTSTFGRFDAALNIETAQIRRTVILGHISTFTITISWMNDRDDWFGKLIRWEQTLTK